MTETNWLQQFEQAAIARNPLLATKLRSGLSDSSVRRALRRARVAGDLDPIIALYTWRDGMDLI